MDQDALSLSALATVSMNRAVSIMRTMTRAEAELSSAAEKKIEISSPLSLLLTV